MKKSFSGVQLFLYSCIILMLFSGCEVIGDIFEAGFWVGVIVVILVVAIVIWLFRKLFS